jgi:hypothetical protein
LFSVFVGAMAFVFSMFSGRPAVSEFAVAASLIFSGLLSVGFGSIVENVAKIEQHLRRRDSIE